MGIYQSDVWNEAKRRARVDLSVKVERITDINELERLRAELDLMIDREMGL